MLHSLPCLAGWPPPLLPCWVLRCCSAPPPTWLRPLAPAAVWAAALASAPGARPPLRECQGQSGWCTQRRMHCLQQSSRRPAWGAEPPPAHCSSTIALRLLVYGPVLLNPLPCTILVQGVLPDCHPEQHLRGAPCGRFRLPRLRAGIVSACPAPTPLARSDPLCTPLSLPRCRWAAGALAASACESGAGVRCVGRCMPLGG